MTIVFAILLFSILIFVHELGHFLAAKASGVQVNEFSMFMGPAIFKKQVGTTLYSIRCIPIGGYCAMEGEDADTDSPNSFQKAKWWKRLIILVAGSFMNFLIGFLIAVIVNACTLAPTMQIGSIRTGSALLENNALRPGDVILQMDGREVKDNADFAAVLAQDPEKVLYDILVQRDGQPVLVEDVRMELREFPKNDEGSAGKYYGINWATRKLTFGEVIKGSFNDCVYFVKVVWLSLKMLVTGEAGLGDMTGPVGIVSLMNDVASDSDSTLAAVLNLLYFGSFIAVNLGVMNLLPIPALDGGRVVALLLTTSIEAVTKKKIDPKYEGYIHAAGMILLLAFMALIMFKDIFAIFKR